MASLQQAVFGLPFHRGFLRFLAPVEPRRNDGVCQAWHGMVERNMVEELWWWEAGNERRGFIWKWSLLKGIKFHEPSPKDRYEGLIETSSTYDGAIKRDVGRTLPRVELFKEKQGKGQQALFRILRALSIRMWDIGYCQSMNFIAATMFTVFENEEEAAFQCALALLLRHSLADLYRPGFPKLGVTVWQFDRLVEGFLPKVHSALERLGVRAEYYALQWFLTLFASDLSQDTVRRIWDRFLVAGWMAIAQTGLAMLYLVQDILPTLDQSHALRFLKEFARTQKFETEVLLRTAATFQVSHKMLSALEAAYSWDKGKLAEQGAEVQLFVVKDLNTGEVHWAVQRVPKRHASADSEELENEERVPLPLAFSGLQDQRRGSKEEDGVNGSGTVLPFLMHNLDTGETTVMNEALDEFVREKRSSTCSASGAMNSSGGYGAGLEDKPVMPASPSHAVPNGGSHWLHGAQQQALRMLGQPGGPPG